MKQRCRSLTSIERFQPLFKASVDVFHCAGGTGGLGLLTAAWLQQSTPSSLLLIGRTGRVRLSPALEGLLQGPGSLTIQAAEASSAEDAVSLGKGSRTFSAVLAGIIHAAGVQVHLSCIKIERWL